MPFARNSLRSRLSLTRVAAGLVLVLVVKSQPARAADEAPAEDSNPAPKKTFAEQFGNVWNRDLFTGDWAGWRTQLAEHGIDAQFRLAQYGQGVADGGRRDHAEYGGTMDYRVNADLGKAFDLWDGFYLSMHARTRWGQDINADAGELTLPNAGLLLPLPGDYDSTNITALMAMQTLFDGRAAVLFGKLDVIDLVNGFFPEIGYGQESFWNVNSLVTAMPWFGPIQGLSLWGGGAWTYNEEGVITSGFLAVGTENSRNVDNLSDSFDSGVAMFGWLRPTWKLAEMPGYFLVFAGGSTRKQIANDPVSFLIVPGAGLETGDPTKKRPWGVAGYLSQTFWQAEKDPSRKAVLTVGGSIGPDDVQFSQWNIFGRVELFGAMASRPADRMGFAAWGADITSDYQERVQRLSLRQIRLRDMWGLEVYYNVEINKWLHVTPDLQLIQNERKGDDLAVIPGIRAVIDF